MSTQRGFTLLEVLIAMIIIAVGLLGIAALQSHAMRGEVESYQRAQALILVDDIINRISANRTAAGCYSPDGATPAQAGYGQSGVLGCTAYGVPTTQNVANIDISTWHRLLLGTNEALNGAATGGIIKAFGCILQEQTNTWTVRVAWQGQSVTQETPNPCPGDPGYDGMRRMVSRTIRIPPPP